MAFYPSLDYCFHVKIAKKYPVFVFYKPLTHIIENDNNASGRIEVQKQWLITDFYCIRQLLKNYHVPDFLIMPFLEERTIRKFDSIQRGWGTKWEIPYDDIIWKGYSKGRRRCAFICMRVLVTISRMFRNIFSLMSR